MPFPHWRRRSGSAPPGVWKGDREERAVIVTLVIACEVAFWVLLAAGLTFRYAFRMPRTGLALLLCEPLLEVVLFAVTAIDLRNGAEPDWKHGLAAVYIGFTVGLGHSTIKWADARVAHRFAGGPPPVRPPKYGVARAVHEWRVAGRWILAAVVATALLQAAIWYVGSGGETDSLRMWQMRMVWLIGINVIIALSYTLFPKQKRAKLR
ncbi:putative membrane protein [Streptomyces avermitilis MA-4680 = NBRC 14893]|uniref:Membrane protein n=1 Tax=Streptomyces avermitilis (strain ATCC 31267 / DSM 46492 / JCM 5070 / NBRC 14893 / NCIMB 12804 / NRRL 8165 / MA-4680) TaxID=227882 RepID=Q82J90_STRAW|nr:putative membrane protein [Streptomyces avermitilis MA-4680 = NBRC 14893]